MLDERGKFSKSEQAQSLVAQFFSSARSGDNDAILTLLADESEFWADGGGKVSVASPTVITDPVRIAKFFSAFWSSRVMNVPTVKQELLLVNARPGLLVSKQLEDGTWNFDTIFSFEVTGNKISRIYVQRNPDKLKNLLKQ